MGYYLDYTPSIDRRMCWDFELMPWVEQGRLRFCESVKETLQLGPNDADAFPFRDILGYPAGQLLWGHFLKRNQFYKPGTSLVGDNIVPTKHRLSAFLEANLPRDGEGNFIKPHYEIPWEEKGDG